MRMAAKAPVAICWLVAGEEEEAAVAEAVEEEPEEPPDEEAELAAAELMVEVMVAAARDSLAETRTAVAFLVPHTSAMVHACWPAASLGWASMHCENVAWQMKKGKVCVKAVQSGTVPSAQMQE